MQLLHIKGLDLEIRAGFPRRLLKKNASRDASGYQRRRQYYLGDIIRVNTYFVKGKKCRGPAL